jgi:WD40 repeat protein
MVLSTDADGIVKVWDIRMVSERASIDTGNFAAYKAVFDPSGSFVVVPTEESVVKM